MMQLKLRKRYYAEALDFIRWLEQGSETLGELLGSTHKTEVLEAMEFFRVSYEYGMESAQVGFSKLGILFETKSLCVIDRSQEDASPDLVQGQCVDE